MAGFFDSDAVRRDPNAKTLSFFCTEEVVCVDESLVEELMSVSEANGGGNARLCLHASPEADFHEMIILERAGHYCRPHRHAEKGESCHVIRGRIAVFVFEPDGTVERCIMLDESNSIMSRIGPNRFHSVLPLNNTIIYHKTKPGPFLGDRDSILADWAPAASDVGSVARFLASLRQWT